MAKSKLPSLDDSDTDIGAVGGDIDSTSAMVADAIQSPAPTQQLEQPPAVVSMMQISVPAMQFPTGAYVSDDVYLKRIPTKSAEKLKSIALGLECRGETLANGTRVRCISHAILYILERLECVEQKI